MIIDLSDIASKKDKSRITKVEEAFGGADDTISNFTVAGVDPFDLHIENIGGKKLVISGQTTAHVKSVCDRCLEDVSLDEAIDFSQTFHIDRDQVSSDADDPVDYLEDNRLDISKLIAGEVLLCLPAKVLCSDDCKGLCPVCGKNRNLGECDCEAVPLDPRMQQFIDVFNEMN